MTLSIGRVVLVGLLITMTGLPTVLAVPCVFEPVPAATLLVPHFSVDLDTCNDPRRSEAVITITNVSDEATISHVTLWTDWGVPVLDFDMYLTGYDVQSLALGDVFCDGILPQTGSAVSPHGPLSGSPILHPSCNNSPVPGGGPNYANPFSSALIDFMQEWFTGKQSSSVGTCGGADRGDNVARGYATVDVVTDCTLEFPSSPNYYTSGILSMNNALLGDVIQFDTSDASAWMTPAVHIQAWPSALTAGDHTFYGRYNNASAADGREPLPSTLQARFIRGGNFDSTEFLVWREARTGSASSACDSTPSGIPVADAEALWFDEQESVVLGAPPLPLATQAFEVGSDALDNPFNSGFALLNLQHGGLDPVYDDGLAQGWVTAVYRATGLYNVARDGVPFDSICRSQTISFDPFLPYITPQIPGIFGDGFESGNTSAWTVIVP